MPCLYQFVPACRQEEHARKGDRERPDGPKPRGRSNVGRPNAHQRGSDPVVQWRHQWIPQLDLDRERRHGVQRVCERGDQCKGFVVHDLQSHIG